MYNLLKSIYRNMVTFSYCHVELCQKCLPEFIKINKFKILLCCKFMYASLLVYVYFGLGKRLI